MYDVPGTLVDVMFASDGSECVRQKTVCLLLDVWLELYHPLMVGTGGDPTSFYDSLLVPGQDGLKSATWVGN